MHPLHEYTTNAKRHDNFRERQIMKRLNLNLFWGFWVILTLFWLALNSDIFSDSRFFAIRKEMVQLTGVLAIAAMAIIMILSLRPKWPERQLGGLDKIYRMHKWLGIGVFVVSIFHWLWAQGPKWAVGAGLLERPHRGPRPDITDPIQAVLSSLRGTAEGIGEWAFYAASALIVIALIKLIPYHIFRYSHRLFPLVYLVLAFHSFVLLDYSMWTTPLGLPLAILIIAGCYAAFISLFGKIGSKHRVSGEIARLKNYTGVHSLETVINLAPGWPGHKAGQFAFATSNPIEGAHPYTIASAWDPQNPQISFISKELGDHTTGLANKLKVGQKVTVEGPYGCFTFDDDMPHQIWIGAGIGITPFIARMKELASLSGYEDIPHVDLFHSTREVDEEALARLADDGRAGSVNLHILIDERDGQLTGERIRSAIPNWRNTSIWFCGPGSFGNSLRKDFAKQGYDVNKHFHQELFEMR